MNKPVVCCISAALLVMAFAGRRKDVDIKMSNAQVKSSEELRVPVRHDKWVLDLLSSKTVPGTLLGEPSRQDKWQQLGVSRVFGEIGRRSALRQSEWRSATREASASDLLPEISAPATDNDVSIDLQSYSVDSESLAITQRHSIERLNANILVELLRAQLGVAQSWQQDRLKEQLAIATKRLDEIDAAMYTELREHAKAVDDARKEAAPPDIPVLVAPIVRRQVRWDGERAYAYDDLRTRINWNVLTEESPIDITHTTAFQERLRDTQTSVDRAIQVLNASGSGASHAQKNR